MSTISVGSGPFWWTSAGLTLLFAWAKVTGQIDWHWMVVLAPAYWPVFVIAAGVAAYAAFFALAALILAAFAAFDAVAGWAKRRWNRG